MTAAVNRDASAATLSVDGRRVRRVRNREAVVDAMLALYAEGELFPTVVQIAERAGLSARSLFRYFTDAEEICQAAVERHLEGKRTPIPSLEPQPNSTSDRIVCFVRHRLDLYEAYGQTFRAGRLHAARSAAVAETLDQFRAEMRGQAIGYFADDLSGVEPRERSTIASQVALVGTFETIDALRQQQGLSRRATERTLVSLLTRILAVDPPSSELTCEVAVGGCS